MEDKIVKYVKNENGQSVGCVMARKVDSNGIVYITGSLCNAKDNFNKKRAVDLAMRRVDTMALGKRLCRMHPFLSDDLAQMTDRARRYFSDAKEFVTSPAGH